MLTKKRMPLFIAIICCVEIVIYLWATWTSTFDTSNFFRIEALYIFDKSARIAGRVSSFLILLILFMLGHSGLKKIYSDVKKKESFLILMTLFTINHLIHFIFVFLLFNTHGKTFNFSGPIEVGGIFHGFITYILIVIVPIMLWKYQHLNKPLYFVIILYVFNISCFIVKTFLGQIKPSHPAYHNRFGIFIITVAFIYVLIRVFRDYKRKPIENKYIFQVKGKP